MNRKQKYISDRLYKLIYVPELIPDWRELPVHVELYMFKNYFLLLNKTFQEKFGEPLDKWVNMYSTLLSAKTEEQALKSINLLLTSPATSGEGEFFRNFDHVFLSNLIIRIPAKELEKDRLSDKILHKILTLEDIFCSKSVFKEDELYTTLSRLEMYNKLRQKRREEDIPEVVYLGVKLYRPENELIEDFKKIIADLQKQYFEKHPEHKIPEYGHIGYKEDKQPKKRPKSYPFDEWERYFKVYVLFELGKKQREIAEQFFPHDAIGSGEAKISQDLKKARKLIKNAWEGDFPGKYY